MDEMKVQEDLVWDKHSGELIGYIDLGDPELNCATMKQGSSIASHILVFLVRCIVNPLKFTLANFATCNATSVQLFPLFWKSVAILEDKCKLKVMGVTSDGASSNRTIYKMQAKMNPVENGDTITYRVFNHLADEERYIYLMGDASHSIKTARNCLHHSGFEKQCSRLMFNNGYYLLWSHISQLFKEDLECGLRLVPKITPEHINLTPFSVMNVKLAAQVLSTSVSVALQTFAPPEALETAKFCEMMDKYFDCLNVRNTTEAISKQKPFLNPYTSVHDERFGWFTNTFLQYFYDWRTSIESRPGMFTANDKAKMFISWQTFETLQMTIYSCIGLIKYLLNHEVKYVLSERFCQDPLENYFGRQRSMGARRDNPNIRTFGYQDNAIRSSKIFRSIRGNCISEKPSTNKIETESLPSRKAKRKLQAD